MGDFNADTGISTSFCQYQQLLLKSVRLKLAFFLASVLFALFSCIFKPCCESICSTLFGNMAPPMCSCGQHQRTELNTPALRATWEHRLDDCWEWHGCAKTCALPIHAKTCGFIGKCLVNVGKSYAFPWSMLYD